MGMAVGGHNQSLLLVAQLSVVPLERIADATGGVKLGTLRNICLQQGHLTHTGRGRETWTPGLKAQRHAHDQRQGFERLRTPSRQSQAHRQPSGDGTYAVNTQPRRPDRQNAVHMRIAPSAPRKSGQPAPTHEFGQSPQRGKQSAGQARPLCGHPTAHQTHPHRTGRSVIKGQRSRQSQYRQHGQDGRQAAHIVHGHIQPPKTASQPSGGKDARGPSRMPPCAR